MNTLIESSWSIVYSVGHKKIDQEHKKIFDISDRLYFTSNTISSIKEDLLLLIEYTKTHLQHEEKYMLKSNYPELASHKKKHEELINSLGNFIKNIGKYNSQEIKEAVFEFIHTSFITHILKDDKQFHHYNRPIHELKLLFKWQDLYKIGEENIDREHQGLFKIAYEALDTAIEKKEQGDVKQTIIKLYDYMKTHFKNEEDYMHSIEYQYVNYHQKLHRDIIERMNNFIKIIHTLPKNKIERKLIEFMDIWLINHIVCDDKRIVSLQAKAKELIKH